MKCGVLLLVLQAALVAAEEDIESREHWKAEAIKLKAQESTSKAALPHSSPSIT